MTGLTSEQVQERIEQGLVNANENPNTRTYKQIIRENTLTFFNFLNLVLLVLVLCVRSYKNSMFVGIILINTVTVSYTHLVCPFLYLNTTLTSILNGLGKSGLCLLYSSISICIRVAFVLLVIPLLGIQEGV